MKKLNPAQMASTSGGLAPLLAIFLASFIVGVVVGIIGVS